MKIIILSVRDTGGTGYTLAHAINKINPEDHAINVRGVNTFINYPTIVDMGDYSRKTLREMTYSADVIVFLGAISPFFNALNLKKKHLKDKKNIFLCMGSEWRWGRKALIEQADKLIGNYKIALGDPGMFMPFKAKHPETGVEVDFEATDEKEVAWLPVVRSFEDIETRFSMNKTDRVALENFAIPKEKVIFVHAPTSELNKGSILFYRVATHAQQQVPNMVFTTVNQQTWISTLTCLARSDVLYDQAPPFPTAYGALSVEAGIFHLPSFSQVSSECRDFIYRHSGLKTPNIAFNDEEDLLERTIAIATDAELRHHYGELNYNYCKQLHDEKPVVESFHKIVNSIT